MKRNQQEIIHPCFGRIRLSDKIAKVLALPDFRDLAEKSQLGSKSLSRKLLNANHNRLQHSIGVMSLQNQLIEELEKKYGKYFWITQREKEILELSAVGHDVGHLAFSHSLEACIPQSHEQRTIEIFQKNAWAINAIYGYDISSDVIAIFENNLYIKKEGKEYQMPMELNILFILRSLLIGTIDCDRIEYVTTDKFMATGEKLIDYRKIFEYITIAFLNDFPIVGFEKPALPLIESLLINRFDQYQTLYYEEDSTLIEMALNEYVKYKWNAEKLTKLSEYEILAEVKKNAKDETEKGTILHRLANIILYGEHENLLFKKFEDKNAYRYFMKQLKAITANCPRIFIRTDEKKISIYNPEKNRVYIKDDDGALKDLIAVSQKIRNLSINYEYVMVDLDPLYHIPKEIRKQIFALFNDKPIEVEKKFVFSAEILEKIKQGEKLLNEGLAKEFAKGEIQKIPNVKIFEWKKVINTDQYYEFENDIPIKLAVRKRQAKNDSAYYIKIPVTDGTSITKREEHKMLCSCEEEFLERAQALLESKGIQVPEPLLIKPTVEIVTHREKAMLAMNDDIAEITCDFSDYTCGTLQGNGFMVECELKTADDILLWYITKYLKSFGFEETNESKEDMAKRILKI